MTKDVIIIVRHGTPALSRKKRMDWRGYRAWWELYDAGGLAETQKIPKKVRKWAARADIILSSPLRRAHESAELLVGRAPDMVDVDLVEAALPPPHLGSLKFRPKTWGTFARIFWYFGISDDMETHTQARNRANRMADKLGVQAQGGKTVFITAHGWINRMIKGSLQKRGWACVKQNGDLHWSYRRLERDTVQESI